MSNYKFKKRASQSGDPIFTATIYGEMVIQTADKPVNVPYEHTYNVPKSVVDQLGVLSPFKNSIAAVQFPVLYPGFQTLATHHIKQVVCEENPELVVSNPNLCNFEQLLEIVEDTDGDIDMTLYTDEYQLRQAVLDYINDPEIFAIQQERLKVMRGQHAATVARVLQLNPMPTAPADSVRRSTSPVLAATDNIHSSQPSFFASVSELPEVPEVLEPAGESDSSLEVVSSAEVKDKSKKAKSASVSEV